MAIMKDSKRNGKKKTTVPKPITISRGAQHEKLNGGSGAQIRFRPNRYTVEELGSLQWAVTIQQDDEVSHICTPLDVAAGGVGILVPPDLVLRINETLNRVTIRYEGSLAYDGRATVATLRKHDSGPFAGLHLLDGLLEVSKLLDLKEIKNASSSLKEQLAVRQSHWNVDGFARFKSLVSDFRLFLEDVEHSLLDIEQGLPWHVVFGDTDSPTRQGIRASFLDGPAKTFCKYFSQIDESVREADHNEVKILKEYSRRHLHQFILQGPLFSRSLEKPRGYAGDYVTMNYIYGRHFEGSSLFGQFVHMAGCQHDVCQAVRNRKDLLKDIISSLISDESGGSHVPRIASIGSGPAQEFYEVIQSLKPDSRPFEVVLFDADDEALNYCFPRLTDLIRRSDLTENVKITMLYDSIGHLLFDDSVFKDTGPFDLILCAGLFDYLPVDKGQVLVTKLHSQLKPSGTLIVGNMTPINSSRWAMEHMAEWYLIYRNREELKEMANGIPPDSSVEILGEPLGINLFLKIRKAGNGHLDN